MDTKAYNEMLKLIDTRLKARHWGCFADGSSKGKKPRETLINSCISL